jgi:hypothetical protein
MNYPHILSCCVFGSDECSWEMRSVHPLICSSVPRQPAVLESTYSRYRYGRLYIRRRYVLLRPSNGDAWMLEDLMIDD